MEEVERIGKEKYICVEKVRQKGQNFLKGRTIGFGKRGQGNVTLSCSTVTPPINSKCKQQHENKNHGSLQLTITSSLSNGLLSSITHVFALDTELFLPGKK